MIAAVVGGRMYVYSQSWQQAGAASAAGARALLNRAARRAADPQPAAHPRPFSPPDAPRR